MPTAPAGECAKGIRPGPTPYGVASAPTDADFAAAAVWRLELPAGLTSTGDRLLRLSYTGDVARVYLGGRLIMNDFYNGLPLELDLSRHAADLATQELTVAILPLQKDAPIYFSDPEALPDFKGQAAVAELHQVEFVALE